TAMDMGLHLYLEKPMAHNVWEIRKLTEIAAEKGLATQLGMQRHTHGPMHRISELIQTRAIGDITEVHSWVDSERGMFPNNKAPNGIPKTLDYDLWLGPVKHKPYAPMSPPTDGDSSGTSEQAKPETGAATFSTFPSTRSASITPPTQEPPAPNPTPK
ncbi:MAG: hypothetical protein VCC01_11085, partial [Candidatus Hydrogenedentota bacterium]